MNHLPQNVSIIGAGLAGTALAIALHQQGIQCQIFESRAENAAELASGVVITPQGCQILDHLGVFSRIADRCWESEYRTYKNDKDETTSKTLITNESLYGYKNHRIWRRLLLAEMKLMLAEYGIEILYNSRFEGVVCDDCSGATFLVNGTARHASLLVGADGIHSSLRKYIAPGIVPEYTGTVGALAHIRRDTVKWPYADYEPACTVQGKPGAFFMMPEDPEAKEVMVGMQVQRPEAIRAERDALAADKDKLCEFFRTGYDDWHDTAKQIIDQVCIAKDSIYLWPFMRMPRLDRWYSETGNALILGDAAHAIPPSSGQGVNQALEDVYTLMMCLSKDVDRLTALKAWQTLRQARVDAVFDWATNSTNVQRLPEAERRKLIGEGKVKDPKVFGSDMGWLYRVDFEKDVAAALEVA